MNEVAREFVKLLALGLLAGSIVTGLVYAFLTLTDFSVGTLVGAVFAVNVFLALVFALAKDNVDRRHRNAELREVLAVLERDDER